MSYKPHLLLSLSVDLHNRCVIYTQSYKIYKLCAYNVIVVSIKLYGSPSVSVISLVLFNQIQSGDDACQELKKSKLSRVASHPTQGGVCCGDVIFWQKSELDWPKWYKSGNFSEQMSVHFSILVTILKSDLKYF